MAMRKYFGMIANRGIYHEGWYANTVPPHGPWILNAPLPPIADYKWELFNLTEDWTQNNDLARPDYGDPVEIRPDELPVFWACGVTPQAVVEEVKPPFFISHYPGAMLVTDIPNATLAVM